jgi:hypothetical protein
MTPLPIITIFFGSSGIERIEWAVYTPEREQPGISGILGLAPEATTTAS